MQTIGGSLFIRNAIKHDYCVEASILSLVPFCDQIVVLDCQSDDGTLDILHRLAKQHKNIQIYENIAWNCAPNYDRLRILANVGINLLKTDWHFMIQADEVLHEMSIPVIKAAVEQLKSDDIAFFIRRPHIFGNMDHHISHELPVMRKPASDRVIRLGRKHHQAVGDAESIFANRVTNDLLEHIVLFHYGYVRKNSVNLSKAIEMQSWFNGPNSTVDQRLVEMQKKDNVFRPDAFFAWNELTRLKIDHPACAKSWVDERRSEFPFEPPQK